MRYLRVSLLNGAILALMLSVAGCSALDVNSPTTLRVGDIQNADGAHLYVPGIYQRSWGAFLQAIASSGGLADEFTWGADGAGDVNARNDSLYQVILHMPGNEQYGVYSETQTAWSIANLAVAQLRSVGAPEDLAEAFTLRGLFMVHLGELICPGFPVANVKVDGEAMTPLFNSDPQTADSAFVRVLADADSALVHATTAGRVNSFAKVLRARALLGLGRFSEAATAASDVPTSFADTTYLPANLYGTFDNGAFVQNREGTNGLDFVDAHDPRLPLINPSWGDTTKWKPAKFDNFSYSGMPIVIASGVEARLIEAEAQLATGGPWLTTINQLRALAPAPGLSDTTDPGTPAARIDLIMRERAFWLFATAHRLGDLRRMMRLYGRDPETIFPVGAIDPYSTFGTATSISFNGDFEHQFNPKITGCIPE